MVNRIAASLALPDTQACLAALHALAPTISMAEIRLDMMASFDLPRLVGEAPCPLILTCRPPREGGAFQGQEAERLDILTQGMDLGCAYIDSEWDSLAALAARRSSATRLIVSRHWTDHMPSDLWGAYETLRSQTDVVKLVGLAQRPADLLPIFEFLRRATSPVIGLAMGNAGRLTRLLAPAFPHCLLTYAAPSAAAITAPGQLSVQEMTEIYHINALSPQTQIHIHLCATEASAQAAIEQNSRMTHGEAISIPLLVSAEEVGRLAAGLRASLPNLTLTFDPALAGTG
ncbi:MAG TPA: type I 3-dehydroquinate dehydratase [Ktedonobacterales bacterium]|jgi:3-dehydroquinate dehydratase/shikimate dehydrogenase